jgi:hypothetical protein
MEAELYAFLERELRETTWCGLVRIHTGSTRHPLKSVDHALVDATSQAVWADPWKDESGKGRESKDGHEDGIGTRTAGAQHVTIPNAAANLVMAEAAKRLNQIVLQFLADEH